MAWRSSGSTNAALVNNLERNGLIKEPRVRQAMLDVDRAHYSPKMPYMDAPQSIGYAATISAPHMHASACESLLPFLKPGSKILDIGSGSGYLTHVIAQLVKPNGAVIGIDHIQSLVDLAKSNMSKSAEGRSLLDAGMVKFVKADGRLGYPAEGPFDAIHVGAAAAEHYQALVDQLKTPGRYETSKFEILTTRLFVPVEDDDSQYIFVTDKDASGHVKREKLYGVRYVPLTDTA